MIPAVTWERDALCAQTDPELFYAPRNSDEEAQAIAVCDACPVRRACLDEALTEEGGRDKKHRYGIRGGLTPGQRFWKYHTAKRNTRKQVAA